MTQDDWMLEKNKSMKVIFNCIAFSWVCSYLRLKINPIWLADKEGPESASKYWDIFQAV